MSRPISRPMTNYISIVFTLSYEKLLNVQINKFINGSNNYGQNLIQIQSMVKSDVVNDSKFFYTN